MQAKFGSVAAVIPLSQKSQTLNILLGLLILACLSMAATAQRETTRTAIPQTPPLMDREKEIALALSACPPSVADKAAVYVLEKSGYVRVRDSQNGFTAIVQHALPISQDPQCMDAEGARTFLPRYLRVAELRAQGKTPEEIKRFVADAFAKELSSRRLVLASTTCCRPRNITVVDAEKGLVAPFPPHVMFYGPYVTNADLGSDGKPDGPVFVAGEGTPHGLIIVPLTTRDHANHRSGEKSSSH